MENPAILSLVCRELNGRRFAEPFTSPAAQISLYGRAVTAKREAQEATKRATTALKEVEKTKSAADELINFLQYDLRDTMEKIGRHDITSAINDRIRKYHLEYPAQAGDFDRSGSKASH